MQCPWCGSPIRTSKINFSRILSPSRLKLVEALQAAGMDGMSATELNDLIGKVRVRQRSPTTIRTMVCNINKLIAPMKVRRKNGKYWLDGTGDSQAAIWSEAQKAGKGD